MVVTSLNEARKTAENEIKEVFEIYRIEVQPPYLSDFYLEEEACWMFFRREDIEIPPEKWPADVAVIISRINGEGKKVGYDKNSLEDAKVSNKVLSDYFLKKQSQ